MEKRLISIGSVFMAIGVALGAFGAHALSAILVENDRQDTWETAVLYHFVHSIGILLTGLLASQKSVSTQKRASQFFIAGILFFCVPLYVLSLTQMNWLGAIAPIGGTSSIVGWLWLAFRK